MINLGENIELSGFKEVDRSTMFIIKKIVGTFVKKISDKDDKFQKLTINLKMIHQTEKDNGIFHLTANLSMGTVVNSEVEDRNILVGLDNLLKKLEKTSI